MEQFSGVTFALVFGVGADAIEVGAGVKEVVLTVGDGEEGEGRADGLTAAKHMGLGEWESFFEKEMKESGIFCKTQLPKTDELISVFGSCNMVG